MTPTNVEELEAMSRVMATLVSAGWKPSSVVKFAQTGDLTKLEHSGLIPAQLKQPGPQYR